MRKKNIIALAALAALLSSPAFAEAPGAGPWQVRARAVHLDSRNSDDFGAGLAINDKWLPEVDINYFFRPDLSAELVLTVPQKQTLTSGGAYVGTLKHLPPTLTLKYHFAGNAWFKPYVGAGINYTRFSDVNLGGVSIERNSFGPALQAGVDIPLSGPWSLNLDVKKAYIRTDVSAGGATLGTFKIDPLLVGVGVGYRF